MVDIAILGHSILACGIVAKGIKCFDLRMGNTSVAQGGIDVEGEAVPAAKLPNNSTKCYHGVCIDPFRDYRMASYGENTVRESESVN